MGRQINYNKTNLQLLFLPFFKCSSEDWWFENNFKRKAFSDIKDVLDSGALSAFNVPPSAPRIWWLCHQIQLAVRLDACSQCAHKDIQKDTNTEDPIYQRRQHGAFINPHVSSCMDITKTDGPIFLTCVKLELKLTSGTYIHLHFLLFQAHSHSQTLIPSNSLLWYPGSSPRHQFRLWVFLDFGLFLLWIQLQQACTQMCTHPETKVSYRKKK